MSDQFAKDARMLVGMTMGARKRMLLREAWKELDKRPYVAGVPGRASPEEAAMLYRKWAARAVRSYLMMSDHLRLNLRPCPGCIGCCTWVIREKKPGQFIGRWVPRDVPRGEDPDFDDKYLQLLDLLNTTKRAHERVDLKAICDNSGTLPAKKAVPVVRCTACGRRAKGARMADGTTNRPLAWVFPEEKRPLAGLCGRCR